MVPDDRRIYGALGEWDTLNQNITNIQEAFNDQPTTSSNQTAISNIMSSSRPVTPASPKAVKVKSPQPGMPMYGCGKSSFQY